jgi:lysophospholipase L1-like esterase
VRFVNVARGGETAAGGLRRLEPDVFQRGATLLIVMYGTNDIGWGAWEDEEHRQQYLDAIRSIVQASHERGVRVVVCSAPVTAADPYESEGSFLQRMCDDGLAIARSLGAQVIDVQRRMREIQKPLWDSRRGSVQANRTPLHSKDGIHLSVMGQYALAYSILEGLGAPAGVSSVTVTAGNPDDMTADGCTVTNLHNDGTIIEFSRLDEGLPLTPGNAFRLFAPVIPALRRLSTYELTVRDLPRGQYAVSANGQSIGTFSDFHLGKGLNLAEVSGTPWARQAKIVQWLTEARNALAFGTKPALYPAADERWQALGGVATTNADSLTDLQRSAAKPTPYAVRIRPSDKSRGQGATPTVRVGQHSAQVDPTNEDPVRFTVMFDSPVDIATFDTQDITQEGTADGFTWEITPAEDDRGGRVFTLTANGITAPGTIIPRVNGDHIQTHSGSTYQTASTVDSSVTYERTRPTVTIERATGQADVVNSGPVRFTVFFSEPINIETFAPQDITDARGITRLLWNLTDSGDHQTFELETNSIAHRRIFSPIIEDSRVYDLAGNGNIRSARIHDTVTCDLARPGVTVRRPPRYRDTESALPVSFLAIFTRPIDPSSFTATDVSSIGTADAIAWSVSEVGDGRRFMIEATDIAHPGTLIPVIEEGHVQDLVGNTNTKSRHADNHVATYDPSPPAVTIEQAGRQLDPADTLPVVFAVSFDKPIDPATLTPDDITQAGSARAVSWEIQPIQAERSFFLLATSVGEPGTIAPQIDANRVTDHGGHPNAASTSIDNEVTFSPTGAN